MPAVLVIVGGVILSLGALFIYAVVSPTNRIRAAAQPPARSLGRSCLYCHSTNTRRFSQPEPRYDEYGFALVTGYECMRCGHPFWCVDRTKAQQHSH